MKLGIFAVITGNLAVLAGCATSSVLPFSSDTVQITSSAAPICGASGAEKVAFERAAIETINKGYDRFIIVGAGAENNVRIVGTTPVQATTYGTVTATGYGNTVIATGQAQTSYTGGYPIVGGSHDQKLVVKMFKEGDPAAAGSTSAREALGPDWATVITKPPRTC